MSIETNYNGRRIVLSDDYLEHASMRSVGSAISKSIKLAKNVSSVANKALVKQLAKKRKDDLNAAINNWTKNKNIKPSSENGAAISKYKEAYITVINKAEEAGDVEWLRDMTITESSVNDDLRYIPYRLSTPVYIKKSDRL